MSITMLLQSAGITSKPLIHRVGWFGNGTIHKLTSYASNDPATCKRQADLIQASGFAGIVHLWYGPTVSTFLHDSMMKMWRECEERGLLFALMLDPWVARGQANQTQAVVTALQSEDFKLVVGSKSYVPEVEKLDLIMIADRLGCSRQRVGSWMSAWGIKRRSHAEGMRLALERRNGHRSPNWRGGQYIANGVCWTWCPQHPRAKDNGAVPTHILVAEERIGRTITTGECVHHLDRNRLNPTPANLCVMLSQQHQRLHAFLGHVGIQLLIEGHIPTVLNVLQDEKIKKLVLAVYVEHQACVSDLEERTQKE